MKLLVLVACVAFVGLTFAHDGIHLSEEQEKRVQAYAADCITKEKTSEESVKRLRKGDFGQPDKSLKCFSNCFLEKTGMFLDGAVKVDMVKTKLGPLLGDDKLKDVMAKCHSVKGDDKCDTAFKLAECYYKNKAGLV